MISNKCNYALRAVLELAKRDGSGPIPIVDIAHAQSIPARFLEAILRELKQAGITESVRGKRGGYTLAKPACEITVGDVVQQMEGPHFVSDPSNPEEDVFSDIWKEAEHALERVYGATHFEELVHRDRERKTSAASDYVI